MSLFRRPIILVFGPAALLAILYLVWIIRPVTPVFPQDYSRLVFDQKGRLLRAFLTTDEQYRFPPENLVISEKYKQALLVCEDKRFYRHPGVDPLALMNALGANLRAGHVVRGGSTLTMQVARLADPKSRTVFNKIRECIQAFRYTVHYSKDEVIVLYASHVPMGGNIVGIHSASWYYFNKPLSELTWAEAALFVVLPNSPGLINLEKDRQQLLSKRDVLLHKLYDQGLLSELDYQLACDEPLPQPVSRLPFDAPHFTLYAANRAPSDLVNTTLDYNIQEQVEGLVYQHHKMLMNDGIANISVLVVETATGKVRAYAGSQNFLDEANQGQVDGVQAPRSTGSLLKPFLAAKALDRGPYTIHSVIKDIPTFYGTFYPQNASKTYLGLATMQDMLISSLNVPAVRLLNTYGIRDFYFFLQRAGFEHLFRSPESYGLPLILGGAEASLWELVRLYLCLGNLGQSRSLVIDQSASGATGERLFSAGSAWQVLETLKHLNRPGYEYYWDKFTNQVPVAWKTGTSYGQKDGWAIGVNQQWTIGVWVGNFTGEGNARNSGASCSAPLMFDLFNSLTDRDKPAWFTKPESDLVRMDCCRQSGYPAGPDCPDVVSVERPAAAFTPGFCPYHHKYLVDTATGMEVCSLCWSGKETRDTTLFIVPPVVKDILEKRGQVCADIPQHAENCPLSHDNSRLELVYPLDGIRIFVPRDIDGELEKVVFSAKHHQPHTRIFWYLDGSYLQDTLQNHEFPYPVAPGRHRLTIQDEDGYLQSVSFSVFQKETG